MRVAGHADDPGDARRVPAGDTMSDAVTRPLTSLALMVLASGVASPVSVATHTVGQTPVAPLPTTVSSSGWPTSHVQGVAVDRTRGFVYYSFTTLLVKTDFTGRLVGTLGGFTGHLGDLDIDERDGRIYGSLEYKAADAFYIAIIDGPGVDRVGLDAQKSTLLRTVHLVEVVKDYTADMNGDGRFDGNVAETADHRYGCSGIDGVSFGPRFGETSGRPYLTVAYGVYANVARHDNDHQVLLQYDASSWWETYAQPLDQAALHRRGPAAHDGKYFVYTGNTTYGVQNLEYDEHTQRWLLGVYRGRKPAFPNYTLFAVDAAAQPTRGPLTGTGDEGLRLPLAAAGLRDEATGIRGWNQKADVGLVSLGDGRFYLVVDSVRDGQQGAELRLSRWTGDPDAPFAPASATQKQRP